MIEALDEALENYIRRELPIKNSEIDVAFDLPNREWSARLNRPTLNLYLHDVRENAKLRQRQLQSMIQSGKAGNGAAQTQRLPVRLDLHYLITAWANEPEDEHRLLSRALLAFFRNQTMPKEVLPDELQNQPFPIPIKAAQYDTLDKPSDIWNVLDNDQRPGIVFIITMAVEPYEIVTTPIVRTRELRFGQAADPSLAQALIEEAGADVFWTIGGTLNTEKSLDKVSLRLVETGEDIELKPEGRFAIGNLKAGKYTLEIAGLGGKPRRQKITVPSPDYDLEV